AADIRRDLYRAVRTATFHSKSVRVTLLPLDAVDRGRVLDALSRLARLYLALAHHILGLRRAGGGVFAGGFNMFIGDVVKDLQVSVTDDTKRAEKTDTVVNPGA